MPGMAVTVLIVDDHPGFRSGARRLLLSDGYEVLGEAANGADAVTLARDLKPDLVLLDVQLPDMDGFAVSDELANLEPAPHVVLVSSRDADDFGSLIRDHIVAGFIAKSELSGAAIRDLVPCEG
jgi:DNA-binding NarL/FixJ family response regulator